MLGENGGTSVRPGLEGDVTRRVASVGPVGLASGPESERESVPVSPTEASGGLEQPGGTEPPVEFL